MIAAVADCTTGKLNMPGRNLEESDTGGSSAELELQTPADSLQKSDMSVEAQGTEEGQNIADRSSVPDESQLHQDSEMAPVDETLGSQINASMTNGNSGETR